MAPRKKKREGKNPSDKRLAVEMEWAIRFEQAKLWLRLIQQEKKATIHRSL